MSSYPPGGDYDERLLDSIPKATKAERQEGYNVNLLASNNSESPMNARPPATDHGHTSLEAGTPPTKEGYISSYSVPWHRQKKWRILMLLGGILLIGAIAGGVAGGVVASKNKSKSSLATPTPTSSSTIDTQTTNSPVSGAQPGTTPIASASGGDGSTTTGRNNAVPTPLPTANLSGSNVNDVVDPDLVVAPVVARSD